VIQLDEAAEGRVVVKHAVVVRVLTGEEGRAGGAAEREASHHLVELRSLAGEQVVDARHGREGGGRLVVGHDHDDVLARERG
jgi:hypothetical protein